MKYIFLVAFILDSLINIVGNILNKFKIKSMAKALIIPFLLIYYLLSKETTNITLVIALCLAYLGDILLIPDGDRFLQIGGFAFGFGHIMFITTFALKVDFNKVPVIAYIVVPILLFTIYFLSMLRLKKLLKKDMLIMSGIYLTANICLSMMASFNLLANYSTLSLLGLIGCLSFFASDVILFIGRYDITKEWYSRWLVMPTYILAIFLITVSMI